MTALIAMWLVNGALTFGLAVHLDPARSRTIEMLRTDPLVVAAALIMFGLIWPLTLIGLIYGLLTNDRGPSQ